MLSEGRFCVKSGFLLCYPNRKCKHSSVSRDKDVASVGNPTTVPNRSAWRGICHAGRGLHLLALHTAALHCLLMLTGGGKGFEIWVR